MVRNLKNALVEKVLLEMPYMGKVFKNEPSEICGRQPFKNLK